MAIITSPLEIEYPGIAYPKKIIITTPLKKQDIVRQGHDGWTSSRKAAFKRASPHPSWHCLPWAWRCVAKWAGHEWWELTQEEKDTWTSGQFDRCRWWTQHRSLNFIRAQCDRWWYKEAFCKKYGDNNGGFNLRNEDLSATGTGDGVVLQWNQRIIEGDEPEPWGCAITRSATEAYPISHLDLIGILPSKRAGHKSFVDTKPRIGENWYLVNSFDRRCGWDYSSEYVLVSFP